MSAMKMRKGKMSGEHMHPEKVEGMGGREPQIPAIKQWKDAKCDIVNGHNDYRGDKPSKSHSGSY